jgi:RHH-type proline utilization regulon transcriptional repressor/proline dehydrogenase/delta 1-pyrroline-5-carboxylate dehydrogenase
MLYVQDGIADKVIAMRAGAMAEMKVGNPGLLSTDVGPVIDNDALNMLREHAERMDREGKPIAQVPVDEADVANGTFFASRAYELQSVSPLPREIFGPILHVIRWTRSSMKSIPPVTD